jgi:hypothetical protein
MHAPNVDRRSNAAGFSRQYDIAPGRAPFSRRLAALGLACGCFCFAPLNASAQEMSTPGQIIGDMYDALHFRPERPATPDFVEQSRKDPNTLDYRPMAPAEKSQKQKTPAELDALGAELEGALARNQRAAASVKTPDTQSNSGARAAGKKRPPSKASAKAAPSESPPGAD